MEVLNDEKKEINSMLYKYKLMKQTNDNNKSCDILKVPKGGIAKEERKEKEKVIAYKNDCINLYLEKVFLEKIYQPKKKEDIDDYEDYEDYIKIYNNKRNNKIKEIKNSKNTYYLELENYNTSSIESVDTDENYSTLFIQLGIPKWNSKSLSDSFNLNNCNAFKQSLADNYILSNIWRVRTEFSAENNMVNREHNIVRKIEWVGHYPDNTPQQLDENEQKNQVNALKKEGIFNENDENDEDDENVEDDIQGGKRKSRRRLAKRKSNKKATKKSKKSRKSRKSRKIRR